eukprot:SAG31_NODE_5235_length_2658_cov_7.828449_1_plen_86_part_00
MRDGIGFVSSRGERTRHNSSLGSSTNNQPGKEGVQSVAYIEEPTSPRLGRALGEGGDEKSEIVGEKKKKKKKKRKDEGGGGALIE